MTSSTFNWKDLALCSVALSWLYGDASVVGQHTEHKTSLNSIYYGHLHHNMWILKQKTENDISPNIVTMKNLIFRLFLIFVLLLCLFP